MRVLKAPDTYTRDRITSEGEVHFENGIATVFTKEQERFFCERIPGYEVVEIADKEPTAAVPAPAPAPEEEVPVTEAPEEVGPPEAEGEGPPSEEVGPPVADEAVEEEPPFEEKSLPEEAAVLIFVKALDRVPKKAKARIIREFGKQPNSSDLAALIDAEKAGRNRKSMIAWLGNLLSTAPDKEEEPIADAVPEEGAEEEAPLAEETAEEETKPMEEEGEGPPEPEEEEEDFQPGEPAIDPGEPGEQLETGAEGTPEGEPIAESEEQSGESEEPSEIGSESGDGPPFKETEEAPPRDDEPAKEEITLPVIQDDIHVVRNFAKDHGISADGGKGQILERIYADQRFKK